ncbi:MAG: hypothetical protein GY839_21700 [candidate division Zixibacteria bacterium]|nr:hypothetical protein [candidate division Zixibacteria bacterium]
MTNSAKTRTFLLWTITIVITLSSVVYQRLTGPTHPLRAKVEIGEQTFKFKLLRSHVTTGDALMELSVPDEDITGMIRYRRFRSHDQWTSELLARDGDNLIVSVPKQPSAGKVMYQISLVEKDGAKHDLTDEPVVIRFKDPVPPYILWPHVLFMFAAMLLSTRAGAEALVRGANSYRIALWTAILLFLGGMILGPIVQKFAFGAFWTGWPWGHDLTDNKTAVAMIAWIVGVWRARKQGGGRVWIIVAAVITLAIYLIPHSVLGSELDYTKMEGQ